MCGDSNSTDILVRWIRSDREGSRVIKNWKMTQIVTFKFPDLSQDAKVIRNHIEDPYGGHFQLRNQLGPLERIRNRLMQLAIGDHAHCNFQLSRVESRCKNHE